MLTEVLESMQARLQRSLGDLLAMEHGIERAAPLRLFWDWALKDANFIQLRLLYQLQVLAAHDQKTYGRYLKKNSVNWLETRAGSSQARAAVPFAGNADRCGLRRPVHRGDEQR